MFFRIEGWVQTPTGLAVPGASVAILDQPADFATQPGTPLAAIFSGNASNSATITAAEWSGQEIDFTFAAVPSDVVPGSFIEVASVNPATYDNPAYLVLAVSGDIVTVESITNPGTYVSGGTVTTSVLPNPLSTDGNGYWFAYAAAGIYSVQIYGDSILEIDYPDQGVGTVAGGSVTSVGLTMPGIFTVAGSPVTTAGTIAVTLANVNANKVWAGPTSGSAAAPTFRALVAADLSGLGVGTVTSVAASLAAPTSILTPTVTGSPVTAAGTIALALALVPQNANTVWAGPTGGSTGNPTFRALVANDLPGDVMLSATLVLTSAQLLTLHGTPIQIVAAPGSGFFLLPLFATFQYKFLTAAYSNVASAKIVIGTTAESTNGPIQAAATGLIDQTASTVAIESAVSVAPQANIANLPLMVANIGGSGEFASGAGSLTITLFYQAVALT